MLKRLSLIVLALLVAFGHQAHAQWLTRQDLSPAARKAPKDVSLHGPEESEGRNGGPLGALKWYWQQRTFGLGYIPQDAQRLATEHVAAMRARLGGKGASSQGGGISTEAASAPWKFIGPNNIGGRVNAVAIHPTDPKTVYVGAADGGVWKTTNGGTAWTPLTDNMPSLAMGALAIDPQNPSTVFAGTGEYSPAIDAFAGYGLLRSTDGGASWTEVGLAGVGAYTRVIVNPKHSNLVYACAGRGGGGVMRSTDGGSTWARILDSGAVTDMALSMNGDNAVLFAGVASKTIYRSMDGGNTWTSLAGSLPFSLLRRVSLDVSPTDWHRVAVVSIDTSSVNPTGSGYVDDMEGVAVSNDGGNAWSDVTPTSSIFLSSSSAAPQGWYDVYIRMDPSNSDHLLLGGISIWETKDNGSSWSNVGRAYAGGIHPDQHYAAFAPSNPSIVYVGCDGGVYSSTNGGSTYTSSPYPLGITQYYSLGIDQTNDQTFGGAQDNGTTFGSTTSFNHVMSGDGDGGFACADPKSAGRAYYCSTDGYPRAYDNGSNSSIRNGISEASDSLGWINPFIADPKTGNLYFGCKNLYTSTNKGSLWSASSRTFGFYSAYSVISAIASFGDGQTLAVGTGGGKVYVTTNAGSSWTDVSTGIPARAVGALQFDPSQKSTLYVGLSGYGAGHMFKTTNLGSTWTNITTTLPDIPVNAMVIDPTNSSAMYIGTDVGVFFSPNGGSQWIPYGTGLPNTSVQALQIQSTKRLLRAGTHGRSMWEAPLINDMPGIAMPTQRSVWAVGDTAEIAWHGFAAAVTIDISLDAGATWQNVATGATGTALRIDTVKYSLTENALVRIGDGTQTVISPLFMVAQRNAGAQLAVVGELPYYLYDIAYDKDLNVLWATDFAAGDNNLYKIDPDNGTLIGTVAIKKMPSDPRADGLTGIKYDPISKNLFVHRVSGSDPWSSTILEISKTGTIVKTLASPAVYGTGILTRGDTLLIADRAITPGATSTQIQRALTSNFDFVNGPNALEFGRVALYGPRGLAYDAKLDQYLLAFTDFEGTGPSDATLNGSYVLFLNSQDGTEMRACPIADAGGGTANIRGMEYDPRGAGNTAWITVLASGGGAKLVKIALEDGPASIASASPKLTMIPKTLDFGTVDTTVTPSKTLTAAIHNVSTAPISLTGMQITPAGTDFNTNGMKDPLMLGAGDSMTVSVTFSPKKAGAQNASLSVTMGDGTSANFPITGIGKLATSGVQVTSLPAGYELEQSYPNPAIGDGAMVPFTTPVDGTVEIRVMDNLGRIVFAEARYEAAGDHERAISLSGLPNGNYVYELRMNGVRVAARKLTLLR